MSTSLPVRPASRTAGTFVASLALLALLPLLPEFYLGLHGHSDLKSFGPLACYEVMVSYLLLAPACLLGGIASRLWVVAMGTVMAVATLVTGFQAISFGARWDLTAHSALLQTSPGESAGFVRTFLTLKIAAALLTLMAAFAAAIILNLKSRPPRRWIAVVGVLAGLALLSPGLYRAVRYGGALTRYITLSSGEPLRIIDIHPNEFHPVTLLLFTHYNYRATHDYYLNAYRQVAQHEDELKGAVPIAGAAPPRNLIFVIGESASRRHWSLYGYHRDTNPEIARLGPQALLYTDVISASVGTQTVLRGMFTTSRHSLPIFPLFTQAGFETDWLSAQYNQGVNDVEVSALVQSCEHRRFLNNAYDENLVPMAASALARPGRHALFLNLFGSHVRYEDRYPAAYDVFHGDTAKTRLIATYDNTIRYTDHVLAQIIALASSRHESTALLYVSDHAEDVYDSTPDAYLFRSDAIAVNAMYEVPFLVWLSPEYRAANPQYAAAVAAARNRPFQTRPIYPTLVDLARLSHPAVDPRGSLFAPDYVDPVRRIGVMNRVYSKSN